MTVSDHEVLFELRREPELLAIADALAETLRATAGRPRARRRVWLSVAVAAALTAAALLAGALVLRASNVESSLVDRALAAVGDQPVLHAVIRQQFDSQTTLVELSSGRRTVPQQVERTEIWFDNERGLKHVITNITGQHTQDELSTPEGITSESGPVWTCARIAAHPVEATRARVSCNFSGENGTTPRQIPEDPPSVDPALGGFLDEYRAALASGAARQVGQGTVDGQHVYWLELRIPDRYRAPGEPPLDLRERVAVASDTYRPLLVRAITNGQPGAGYEVVEIGTMPRSEADFSKPKLLPPGGRPTSEGARVTGELDFAAAAQILGNQPLWAGPELAGLQLAGVQQLEVTIGYGRDSGVPPRVTTAINVVYGEIVRRHPTAGSVEITEAADPDSVWWGPFPSPPDGYLSINSFGWGTLRLGDIYVRIDVHGGPNSVAEQTVVEAARTLVAVPPA